MSYERKKVRMPKLWFDLIHGENALGGRFIPILIQHWFNWCKQWEKLCKYVMAFVSLNLGICF